MMTGLQQQQPWGVSAPTRSAPQVQHGANVDTVSFTPEVLAPDAGMLKAVKARPARRPAIKPKDR
jgi:hypothetical protein